MKAIGYPLASTSLVVADAFS